jgi:hypothetical protein
MTRFDFFIYGGFGAVVIILTVLTAAPFGIMWG